MRIVAHDLTFTYNQKTKFAKKALDNVSLTVEEGSFFGIIGHTGSGKSTFVQHLNGLIPVESGTLTVGDFDLSKGKKADKKGLRALRAKIGMVFQYPEYQLFATTVYEDVAFGYKNFFPDKTEEETRAAVMQALVTVRLNPSVAEKSPFDLSGGQKRRVAIAGVLVSDPDVLVLDEPVAGLDPAGKTELMELLHRIHNGGDKTIVIVSHDMDDVAENCDAVAVFSEGKVVMTGTPEEIFARREELESLRLDVPVTEKLLDSLRAEGFGLSSSLRTDDFVSAVSALWHDGK